jgi:hypothetical protein
MLVQKVQTFSISMLQSADIRGSYIQEFHSYQLVLLQHRIVEIFSFGLRDSMGSGLKESQLDSIMSLYSKTALTRLG